MGYWQLRQKELIDKYIEDASDVYTIDHTLMEKYRNLLEPGDVVIVYGLQKYCETTWMKHDKVAFKDLWNKLHQEKGASIEPIIDSWILL